MIYTGVQLFKMERSVCLSVFLKVFCILYALCIKSSSAAPSAVPHLLSGMRETPLLVDTALGRIEGIRLANSTAYLGIPFARPPIGNLRWQDPVEIETFDLREGDVFNARHNMPGCPQYCNDPPAGCPDVTNENCLYLNIYVPTRPRLRHGDLPVVVYLHGGNFQAGASSATMYDGRFLASETDTIVVVTNYRLGALGFLYLVTENVNITGNFGLKDQELALKFIHKHIYKFGGDPKKVTLVGQSAGAESIGIHLLNSEVSKYFSQAVMLSNPFSLPLKTPPDANDFAEIFLSKAGCDSSTNTMECMQSLGVTDILDSQYASNVVNVNNRQYFQLFQQWGPVVTEQPIERFATEDFERKPTILGTTSEEARIFVFEAFPDPLNFMEYTRLVSLLVPSLYWEIREHYPRIGSFFFRKDEREVLSKLVTDYMFTCSTFKAARDLRSNNLGSPSNVFMYIFDKAYSFGEAWEKFESCYGHTCHGGDLAYLFRSAPLEGYAYTSAEKQMMNRFTFYLANFFHHGNPNVDYRSDTTREMGESLKWNALEEGNNYGPSMVFTARGSGTELRNKYKRTKCSFWDSVGYYGVGNANGV